MKSYRWDGTVTALSSIAHGGDVLGTVTYLRREKFLLPDGTVDEIPVVSGNGLRGMLRDTAATMLWEHLGSPKLPLGVAHALWSGGALVKAKSEPLSGERLAHLRRTIAHVGVFGAAGGGRIISGALQVGKLLPICQQTAHVLPEHLKADGLPDMWDLVQVENYTRLPNADRLPETVERPEITDEQGGDLGQESDGLMRYGVETLIAGTRFYTWMALSNATASEYDFFCDTLARYTPTALVGGRNARGHGQLRFDISSRCVDGDPETGNWRALGGATVTEALSALKTLN